MYSSYDYTPQEDFAEVLLRTGKLAETNSEGQNLFPATEGSAPYTVYIYKHLNLKSTLIMVTSVLTRPS